jgi:hypothetical protein
MSKLAATFANQLANSPVVGHIGKKVAEKLLAAVL